MRLVEGSLLFSRCAQHPERFFVGVSLFNDIEVLLNLLQISIPQVLTTRLSPSQNFPEHSVNATFQHLGWTVFDTALSNSTFRGGAPFFSVSSISC